MPEAAPRRLSPSDRIFCFSRKIQLLRSRPGRLPAGPGPVACTSILPWAARADSDASACCRPSARRTCGWAACRWSICSPAGRPDPRHHRPPLSRRRRQPAAYAYEVYSIDSVAARPLQGETITEFRPFFAPPRETPEHSALLVCPARPAAGRNSPGYETSLSIVDAGFDPVQPRTDVLSLELSCTNRDLPTFMSVGRHPAIFSWKVAPASAASACYASPPSPGVSTTGRRPVADHLAPGAQPSVLTGSGLAASRKCSPSTTCRAVPRRVGRSRACGRYRAGRQTVGCPASPLRASCAAGSAADDRESSFVGGGLHAFARCIDHFLGLYAGLNSFTQLVLVRGKPGGTDPMRAPQRRLDAGLIADSQQAPSATSSSSSCACTSLPFAARRAMRCPSASASATPCASAFAPSQAEGIDVICGPGCDTAELGPSGSRSPRLHGHARHPRRPAHPLHRAGPPSGAPPFRHRRAGFSRSVHQPLGGHFYRAWKKYRLPVQYEMDPRNHFLP